MIVPMKKVYVVTQEKDAALAVEALSRIGIVHVQHGRSPVSQGTDKAQEKISALKKALEILSLDEFRHGKTAQEPLEGDMVFKKANEIIEMFNRMLQLEEEKTKRQTLISQWEAWGDFDPHEIEALKERGIYAGLYMISADKVNSIPEGVIVKEIVHQKKTVGCMLIMRKEKKLPFQELSLPQNGLSRMKDMQKEVQENIQKLVEKISSFESLKDVFKRTLEHAQADLNYQQALAGMQSEEKLSYLKGYCPAEKCDRLQKEASEQKWAVLFEDPAEEDTVPTLLKNPRWVELIKPLFSMMNILPGYKEIDISLFFLFFMSIFFGMLIGDAGYGLIFLGLTFFAQQKTGKKKDEQNVFFLMYVLSTCAVIWGVLTATFFGQSWLPSSWHPLVPWLSNAQNVQKLCFFIGVVHLSIAHVWRGILKMPSIAAIAEVGWLSILWAMFFLAKVLILDEPFPPLAKYLLIVGPTLVILFSKPNRNILKGALSGLGDLLISVLNMFTDIVSYIRLFAVGLATVAMADSFNQMAAEIGMHSVVSGLITALILVFGHLLNMTLGALAILVHGVRLNVLEFSSHLNMEWTGIPYKPLKKAEQTNA